MRTAAFLLVLSATLAAPGAGLAQDEAEAPAVMRDADAALSCSQISEEAARLSADMGGAPGSGLLSSVGDVARSGAAMVIPGAGLVMAGADAVTRPGRERREAEATAVEQRWFYLNGLHTGKGCQQQAATAPLPAAAPAAPAGPVVPGIAVPVGALPAATPRN